MKLTMRKKAAALLTTLVLLTGLAGCGASTAASSAAATPAPAPTEAAVAEATSTPAAEQPESENRVLVAYYSNTGNTEAAAQQIAAATGGTLAEIERAVPYGDLRAEAEAELNDGVRPEITVSVDNVADYDTIFVGYPLWWNEAPTMIVSFLQNNDFSGKTIIPFCTSSSDSIDNSLHIFAEFAPDATIAQALIANDSAEIAPWLESLGFRAAEQAPAAETGAGTNILIAYFSVPEDLPIDGVDAIASASIVVQDGTVVGNTQFVAQAIQSTIGGDLFRIETAQPYPLEHDPLVDFAAAEQDDDARPALAAQLENADAYDVILLGYPNWWSDMPQPLYTFLESYDFSGKTIIPFVTHGGSRTSNTVSTIAALQPNATVLDATLVIARNDVAGSSEEVIAWAQGLNLGA